MNFPRLTLIFRTKTHVEPMISDAHDVDVWIPAEQSRGALIALTHTFPELPKYQSRRAGHAPRDLTDALNRLGQHSYIEYGDRSVRVLFISSELEHNQAVYGALAPFVPEECSITVINPDQRVVTHFSFANHTLLVTTPVGGGKRREDTDLTGRVSQPLISPTFQELGG